MTQQDVYLFLKKNEGVWYSPRQVAEKMTISINSATNALRKLRKHNFVEFKQGQRKDSFLYAISD